MKDCVCFPIMDGPDSLSLVLCGIAHKTVTFKLGGGGVPKWAYVSHTSDQRDLVVSHIKFGYVASGGPNDNIFRIQIPLNGGFMLAGHYNTHKREGFLAMVSSDSNMISDGSRIKLPLLNTWEVTDLSFRSKVAVQESDPNVVITMLQFMGLFGVEVLSADNSEMVLNIFALGGSGTEVVARRELSFTENRAQVLFSHDEVKQLGGGCRKLGLVVHKK